MSDAPPASARRAAGLLALAALLGAALGSAITARALAPSPWDGHHRSSDWYINLLDQELKLSPVQEDTLRVILSRYSPTMDSVWASIEPRMDSIRRAIRVEVRGTLTPVQREKYQQVTDRLDQERRTTMNRDSTKR